MEQIWHLFLVVFLDGTNLDFFFKSRGGEGNKSGTFFLCREQIWNLFIKFRMEKGTNLDPHFLKLGSFCLLLGRKL